LSSDEQALRYNRDVNQSDDQRRSGDPDQVRDPLIEAYKKDIDRTLIRENLRLTVDERFQQLMKLQQFAEELRRAGKEAKSRQ
jgi:hypothetical protein